MVSALSVLPISEVLDDDSSESGHRSSSPVAEAGGDPRRSRRENPRRCRADSGRIKTICDAATGLLNRRAFQSLVDKACLERNGKSFSVVMIDLDGFQNLNDALGHGAGDQVLIQVAKRLQECIGERDDVARLGNDEFAILHCTGRLPGQPRRLVNRLAEMLRQPFMVEGTEVVVTASIGAAVAPDDSAEPAGLFKAAELAMQCARERGGNCWRRFRSSMEDARERRRSLHKQLVDAVAAEQFVVHYQPIVDIRKGLVSGFEALVRWNQPERGLVLPEEFLPVAEAGGSIVPIGQGVMNAACREAAKWPSNYHISVNVSQREFRSDIVRCITRSLAESQIEASRLTVEVNESLLLDNRDRTLEKLRRLSGLGVQIVLDNFGAHCASLRWLQQFPFDRIKIDRRLIRGLASRLDQQLLVRAILGLTRDMEVEVVAEGVETPEELRWLRKLDCRLAQGFLFSRPVSSEDALRYLKNCAVGQGGF